MINWSHSQGLCSASCTNMSKDFGCSLKIYWAWNVALFLCCKYLLIILLMAPEIIVKVFWHARVYISIGWWHENIYAAKTECTLIGLVPAVDRRKPLLTSPTYSCAGHRDAKVIHSKLNHRSNAFCDIMLFYWSLLSFITSK